MKGRLIPSLVIIVSLIASVLISCTGKTIKNDQGHEIEILEGWINENTYQIAAGGMPVQGLKAIDQRKESARLDAIMNARCQIIEKFSGVRIRREELKNNVLDGISIKEELKSLIQTGVIKKTVWDYDENCEIIFEVKCPGLKKKVEDGELR